MKRSLKILCFMLVALIITSPAVLADATTNEAIEDLAISFSGTGTSTMVTINVWLNSVALNDQSVTVKFYIDEVSDANLLGQTTEGTYQLETVWDITKWSEGYHVLIAELYGPTTEVASDNKADNRLDLPFTTQGWIFAIIGDVYGAIQFQINKLFRLQLGGYLSIFASYSLWMWIIVIILIAVAIKLARRYMRKHKKPWNRKPWDIHTYRGD